MVLYSFIYFLKLGSEDGMALKPTWEVKDGGGMGMEAHVSLGEWPPFLWPCTQEVVLGRAGLQSEDCQAISEDLKGGKLGRMRDGSPKQEMHVSRWSLPWAKGCLHPRESKQSMQVKITPLSDSVYFSQNHQHKSKQFLFSDRIPYPPNLEGNAFVCSDQGQRNMEKAALSEDCWKLGCLTPPRHRAGTGSAETFTHGASEGEQGHAFLSRIIPEKLPPAKPVPCSTQL